MEGLVMAGQLILALSILVSLHEFGHYITAKWFKMRVDKFYLFFDFLFPVPTVLNFALFKKKVGETEYGIGWFPLGGYVSIAGMIDETQDASKLATVPEPWEFRGKPAWQRLIVMLGGIIVNIILGILIFWGIRYHSGNNYVTLSEVNKQGIFAGKIAEEVGFKTGDKILKVNGNVPVRFDEVTKLIMEDDAKYTIERNGETKEITLPKGFLDKLADGKKGEFIQEGLPFDIKEVAENEGGGGAFKAGLKTGDKFVNVAGKPVKFYQELAPILMDNKGKTVSAIIDRKGALDTLKISVSSEGKIGIRPNSLLKDTHEDYTIGQAFNAGFVEAFAVVGTNLKGFKKIFKGEVSASNAVSGPVGIAKIFGGKWDWANFWFLTGLLSMSLAFMNALPIPALDGGHALFLIWEMITGKTPSIRVQEIAQQVGTVILLGLMVFAFGNDIFKIFK
ncbi:regulator of sigma E protease [Arcicella aurantiaca]|uniref:Zinc metalloprotease n=1 Tax=Arcicella aurantiaca TaxID=591202 RepID=A0A316EAB4_9BACT|nr:RIP metalloprotease RseP [Arcicella aurantiaca]PWK27342.1 regulator of sigma E protease [Arcicella aurantiaca]